MRGTETQMRGTCDPEMRKTHQTCIEAETYRPRHVDKGREAGRYTREMGYREGREMQGDAGREREGQTRERELG